MNKVNSIQALLGETDIYLIDQIMKERYNPADRILDAGCGSGKNIHWFLQSGFHITGIDINEDVIQILKKQYPKVPANRLLVSSIEETGFMDNNFDHIICSAVLHFANSTAQFNKMIHELVRILKPGGTLFLRMTSDIGIEAKVVHIANGVYIIPDGTTRFLLNRSLLTHCMQRNKLVFAEPLKTTNVDDTRCMSTLLLQKK